MHTRPSYNSIICFGDSLTQWGSLSADGFVKRLQEVYIRKLDVINRGFGGYTSRQGLALCPLLFEQDENAKDPQARLATIWFGTNDACQPGFNQQHVPLEEFRTNMKLILTYHFHTIPVLLITPTTVVPDSFGGHLDDSLHQQYAEALQELADEVNQSRSNQTKVVAIEMRKEFLQASSSQKVELKTLFDTDGLHISSKGYEVVFDAIMNAIEKHFPNLMPDKLPFVIPEWSILDMYKDQEGQAKQLQPRRFPIDNI